MRLGSRHNRKVSRGAWLTLLAWAVVLTPVGARAAAGIDLPVPIAVIYPGDVISGGQLTSKAYRKAYARRIGAVSDHSLLVGKVARRTLLPGKPIMAGSVRPAYQIERAKPVKVIYRQEGVTIIAIATALASGTTGQLIKVRNLDSGLTIAGEVQADGSVLVRGQ